MEQVAADPNVDGIMIVLTPQAMTEIEETAAAVVQLSKSIEKPVLACFMGEASLERAINLLVENGVPNYPFPERAALAFHAMSAYREIRSRPEPEFTSFEVDRESVRALFERVLAEERVSIGDFESREVLKAYHLRMPESEIAENPDHAIEIANRIGFPVVLKIASPDILHKTDVGGVKVGLRNPEEVRDAFELMVYRAERYIPDANIWGCLVQQMVPQGGLEVLVGMNRDPQFGPLVTFGLGGIYVETLKDVTFRVAPFSKQEAEQMLKEIRAHALLDGVRGQPAYDKNAIVEVLLRIGQLVQDFPEIAELDINPLMVYPQNRGAIAIDMRLVLS
jgi:acetate---CoA ligase (ADP-forming)